MKYCYKKPAKCLLVSLDSDVLNAFVLFGGLTCDDAAHSRCVSVTCSAIEDEEEEPTFLSDLEHPLQSVKEEQGDETRIKVEESLIDHDPQ